MTATGALQAIRDAKATYAAVGALLGGVLMGATLPTRVSALEAKVEVLERIAQYQGCRAYFSDTGRDPADCAIIHRDLEDFFVPPAGANP